MSFQPGDRVREKGWDHQGRDSKYGIVSHIAPNGGVFVNWDSGEIVTPEVLELVSEDEE